MKKSMKSVLLAGAMAIALTGCTTASSSASAPASSAAVSGTFEGTSVGMQGNVTVTLTVEEGKITNAELTECHETPKVTSVAMERIPAQIVEFQTTDLDNVTGATLCSNAIKRAATAAAEAAGLDMDALKANAHHAEAGEAEEYTADVVVVGAGGAGFAAAITAAQNGSSVIMIEKAALCGGNTLMQGGAFNAYDEGGQAETVLTTAQMNTLNSYLALTTEDENLHFDQFPEWAEVLTDLQADIKAYMAANEGKTVGEDMPGYDSTLLHMWHIYTGGLRQMLDGKWVASDIELARTLADNAYGTYQWCVDDLKINGAYGEGNGSTLYTVLGAMWPRTHIFMTSTELIDVLIADAEAEGVTIYTETAGKSLIKNDAGEVVGVQAEKADGTPVTLNAKSVVLACGGYGANAAMAKEFDNYWGDNLSDHTLTTNVGTNTGDGITMGMEAGADTTGLDVVQLMPSSSAVKGTMTDGIWGDASEQIWIDGNGDRFVNEYAERDVLASSSLALEDGIFYIIYAGTAHGAYGGTTANEEGMVEGAVMTEGLFGIPMTSMVENNHVWVGSTLAELAEATKTPAGGGKAVFTEEKLRETIEKYNEAVKNQNDPEFGKEVLAGAIDLESIEANPDAYIVISPRRASIHHTMGGLKINTNGEVLNTDGTAIPGLFAAGEVTGGIHAGNRLGGNAVADIFTFGHIAGASASENAK